MTSEQPTTAWRPALLHALLPTVIIFGLMVYWYGIADRYGIFLYYHNHTGTLSDVTPLGPATLSRYRMSGLVACGVVLLLNTTLHWLLGHLHKGYDPPAWWRIWCVSAIALSLGIPAITMSLNSPVMPLGVALQIVACTLVSLALALLPTHIAARNPNKLVWLTIDGVGPMLMLLTLNKLDLVVQWLRNGRTQFVAIAALASASGLLGLLAMTALGRILRRPAPTTLELLLSGAIWAYLLMPLAHWALFTDGYYYITDAANFFSASIWIQLAAWAVVGAIVAGVTALRTKWNDRAQNI